MNEEPRYRGEYSARQIQAAKRVLVDLGQVLGAYHDCLVVVGGWVPDLLLPEAEEAHIGSIDVDLALDAARLNDGRYAELLTLLLGTRRYRPGSKPFQLVIDVDLQDGEPPIQVPVEFLAPKEVKLKKNRPRLVEDFRVLQADACGTAFRAPVSVLLEGQMVGGARNRVTIRVANLADALVMKAHALAKRDKPKDAYDICYMLEERREVIAGDWRLRLSERDVVDAVHFLRERFASTEAYGPMQFVEFHGAADLDERAIQARRAYELVQAFLAQVEGTAEDSPR